MVTSGLGLACMVGDLDGSKVLSVLPKRSLSRCLTEQSLVAGMAMSPSALRWLFLRCAALNEAQPPLI